LDYRGLSEWQERHDFCLYFVESVPEIEGVAALAVVL
jgi:hypothetical protein